MEKKVNPWYYYLKGVLIKKEKPFLPGAQIHLHKWEGCYKVESVSINSFTIRKNRDLVSLPWDQFRCLKGEGTSEETVLKKELKTIRFHLAQTVSSVDRIIRSI